MKKEKQQGAHERLGDAAPETALGAKTTDAFFFSADCRLPFAFRSLTLYVYLSYHSVMP